MTHPICHTCTRNTLFDLVPLQSLYAIPGDSGWQVEFCTPELGPASILVQYREIIQLSSWKHPESRLMYAINLILNTIKLVDFKRK